MYICNKFARIAVLTSAFLFFPTSAIAQAYPDRTIRLIVPSATGSMNDIVARIVAKQLSQQLAQAVNIDNQEGERGTLAADTVAKSAPDGYTLLLGNELTMATNFLLKKQFPYDPLNDFTSIASLAEDHFVLVANPTLPVNNLGELIALAKTTKISYASTGKGTSYHLAGALLAAQAGGQFVHAEYANIPNATNALFDNNAQIMFMSAILAKRHLASGKVKALGIGDSKPNATFAGVAPIATTLPGFSINGWFGLFGPSKLPPEIIARLNSEVNKALAANEVKSRLGPALLQITATGGKPEELASMLKDDFARRSSAIKAAGFVPD